MNRFIAATLCGLMATGAALAQDEKQPAGQPPGGVQPPGGPGGGRQFRGGFGGGMFGGVSASYVQTLEMPEVQNELKLTADEKGNIPLLKEELTEGDKKFGESLQSVAREERMEKMNSRREEVEKQIKEVLGDKYTRFRQIKLQLDGLSMAMMMDKEVRDALNVTDEQRTQLREAMRPPEGFFTPGERPSEEKMKEMREQMQKRQAEALDKVLTAEQKKKWEELTGPKISFKRPAMQFGGPGGRGFGGPGGPGGREGGREGGRRRRGGEGGNPPPAEEKKEGEQKPPQVAVL